MCWITWRIAQTGKFSENLLQKLRASEKIVAATAKIQVIEKQDDTKSDSSTGTKDTNSMSSTASVIRKATPANSQAFPKTGEKAQHWLYGLGIVCILVAGYLWWRKRKG